MQRRVFVNTGATLLAALGATAAGNAQTADPSNMDARKQVVRRLNREVIEEGRRDAFEELVDPAFVNRTAPPGTPTGREGMWHVFQNVFRPALGNLRVHIHELLCEGELVTTRKTISGQHVGNLMGIAPTGRPLSFDVIDIVRIRDGRYVEHWGINTLGAVLSQLRSG